MGPLPIPLRVLRGRQCFFRFGVTDAQFYFHGDSLQVSSFGGYGYRGLDVFTFNSVLGRGCTGIANSERFP